MTVAPEVTNTAEDSMDGDATAVAKETGENGGAGADCEGTGVAESGVDGWVEMTGRGVATYWTDGADWVATGVAGWTDRKSGFLAGVAGVGEALT